MAGRPRKQAIHFVWHYYLDFSSPFNSRLDSPVMAFLSELLFHSSMLWGKKVEKNYLRSNCASSNVTSESPSWVLCLQHQSCRKFPGLLRFWAPGDIPTGCLEGSYISTMSLQACTAHGLRKSLITHRRQILVKSDQHSRWMMYNDQWNTQARIHQLLTIVSPH